MISYAATKVFVVGIEVIRDSLNVLPSIKNGPGCAARVPGAMQEIRLLPIAICAIGYEMPAGSTQLPFTTIVFFGDPPKMLVVVNEFLFVPD